MRARALIPAWAKSGVLAFVLPIAACADHCGEFHTVLERVRSGEADAVVSHRVVAGGFGRSRRPRVTIVRQGDFMPLGVEKLDECLGADWRGGIEVREGWRTPATVYRRAGWPVVTVFEGPSALEVRVEATR